MTTNNQGEVFTQAIICEGKDERLCPKPEKPNTVGLLPAEKKLIFCLTMFFGVLVFGSYLIGKWTLDSNGGKLAELVYQVVMQILPGILGYYLIIRFCDKISMSVLLVLIFVVMAAAHIVFVVLALNGNTALANILFGIIFGLSRGAFWGCCNNLHVSFVNRRMRGRYFGTLGVWTQTINIIAPLIMLVLVVVLGGNVQIPTELYLVFFGILLVCCLCAAVSAYKMKISKYKHKFTLRQLFEKKDPRWKKFLVINFLYGTVNFYEPVVSSILILAFAVFQNYFYLLMLVISYILSIATNYLFAKPFFARNRVAIYYLCLIVTSIIYVSLILLYDLEFGQYIAVAILMIGAVFRVARDQCDSVMHTSVIAECEFEDNKLSGAFFLRELSIAAGKIASSCVVLAASFLGEKNSLFVGILIAYFLPSILIFVICRNNFEGNLK